ncbi:MAG: HPF/RaiA family ribosome-associated protein [Alphaproteobacteria bacterium]|nr:HPF/RaiA family ribosome-associated protein [Alphaproteobacteria bacterium]MBN2779730.1 HPF/RaiA family ribosome-associated protein [Alphaproteobacteria bacterium]
MIRITARHLKLGDGFISFMRSTLKKRVEKFSSKTGYPEIIIDRTGATFKAEINYPYRKELLLATNTADNAKKAFMGAMEKLRRQLERTHEKRTDYVTS